MYELSRGSVQTWECDAMGHLNVQFYVAHAIRAGLRLMELTRNTASPGVASPLGIGEQHIRFHRELRPGSPFHTQGGLLLEPPTSPQAGDGANAVAIYTEIINSADHHLAATVTSFLESGSSLELLGDNTIDRRYCIAEVPQHGRSRGLSPDRPRDDASWADAERLGLTKVYSGPLSRTHADDGGWANAAAFMAALSEGIPQLILHLRGEDRSRDDAVGGAALEYRFRFRRPARSGVWIEVRSGLKEVGRKTYVLAHWIFDADSRKCLTTAEAVVVGFDRKTRRSVELTPQARDQLNAARIADLSW